MWLTNITSELYCTQLKRNGDTDFVLFWYAMIEVSFRKCAIKNLWKTQFKEWNFTYHTISAVASLGLYFKVYVCNTQNTRDWWETVGETLDKSNWQINRKIHAIQKKCERFFFRLNIYRQTVRNTNQICKWKSILPKSFRSLEFSMHFGQIDTVSFHVDNSFRLEIRKCFPNEF